MPQPIKHYTISDSAAQAIKRTLNNGLRGLRFENELEPLFERYHHERYFGINKFYPLLGALLLIFFLFADRLVIPELLDEAILFRTGGTAAIFLILAFSHVRWVQSNFQWLLCIGTLIIHIMLLVIGAMAAKVGQFHYQSGTILTMFFMCSVLRIQFHYVFPVALASWLLQIFSMHFFMNLSPSHFTELLFVFTFVTAIGLLVNYRAEYETRKNFLQQLLLMHEQDDLMRTRNELKRLSMSDVLTRLANRRSFNEFLDKEWRRAQRYQQPIAILMIDVDCFKAYNDNYGHQMGDDCLVMVADCLAHAARRPTDLVARYGGEEFVIVLPQTDLDAAYILADNARQQVFELNLPHAFSAVSDRVTLSIGICCMTPSLDISSDALIKEADNALYQAKRSGKNRVCTAPLEA